MFNLDSNSYGSISISLDVDGFSKYLTYHKDATTELDVLQEPWTLTSNEAIQSSSSFQSLDHSETPFTAEL